MRDSTPCADSLESVCKDKETPYALLEEEDKVRRLDGVVVGLRNAQAVRRAGCWMIDERLDSPCPAGEFDPRHWTLGWAIKCGAKDWGEFHWGAASPKTRFFRHNSGRAACVGVQTRAPNASKTVCRPIGQPEKNLTFGFESYLPLWCSIQEHKRGDLGFSREPLKKGHSLWEGGV